MAHYMCADLHGQYWAWEKIKRHINADDTLIFLGDAIDRGPDGVQIAMELLKRPNATYLLGNHEDMMLNYFAGENKKLWYYNGGEITHQAIKELDAETRKWFLNEMNNLPTEATYQRPDGKIFSFSHAGYTPRTHREPIYNDLIWDRNHYTIDDNWDEKAFPDTIIVHGHTPITFIVEDRNMDEPIPPGAFHYCNGHKIDVDCGVHFTGHTVLLNVDTMEEIVLDKND